jgi:hypothetical protein
MKQGFRFSTVAPEILLLICRLHKGCPIIYLWWTKKSCQRETFVLIIALVSLSDNLRPSFTLCSLISEVHCCEYYWFWLLSFSVMHNRLWHYHCMLSSSIQYWLPNSILTFCFYFEKPGETIKEIARPGRLKWINKWPNSMFATWWWWNFGITKVYWYSTVKKFGYHSYSWSEHVWMNVPTD